jgi:DNA mismatch repair protein MutS
MSPLTTEETMDAIHELAVRQYQAYKAQYPDYLLLFHIGDVYEAFSSDAEVASRILGQRLKSLSHSTGVPVFMTSVPFDKVEIYNRLLIAAGHKVAICEYTTEQKQG